MNITLNKTDFLKALQVGGIFAGSNKLLPILDCVKIKVSGDKLTIVSSDKENAISKRINGIIADGDGTFCVNARDLMSYIKLIPSDTFEFTINENTAEIKHEKGNFSLPVESVDDFPTINPDEESKEAVIDARLLNNWIVDGRTFVASDTLRPIMEGLYIYCSNGELGCCSSDGHALFTDHISVDGVQDFNFVLNKNSFRPVCDAIANVDEVKIKIGEKNVVFIADGVSVIARQIEGRYPSFNSIISNENNIIARIDKKQMIDSILRCAVSENKASNLVKLLFISNTLNIESEDTDYNKKSIEKIDCEINAEMNCIGFKSTLLIRILNAISTPNVVINMKDPTKAAILKEEVNNNKIFLLMPCLVD